jgi:hypothetical protein
MKYNEMKFGLDQKVELKNFFKLFSNFGKGLNESCRKFGPFCMA